MPEVRILFPPYSFRKIGQKNLGWILSSIVVFLVFTSNVLASAHDTGCTTSTKQETLALLDARTQHHVRYKRKYDIDCIGSRGIGKGLNFYSMNRERALGEQIAKELDTHLQFVNDPELNAYVNSIVQDLAIHSDAQILFSVKIVKSDEINAYSLPGGFLYVNTGLILDVPDEATLAGLLAHEIAHVAARHGTKTLTKRYIFKVATLPMTLVGGLALTATDVAVPMLMHKFSRDSEREADLLGIEYAYSAGYDPQEFVRFFETLNEASKQKLPFIFKMFATHPVSKDRIQRAQAEIDSLLPSKSEYVLDTSRFDEMKQRLSDLLDGPCGVASGKPVLLTPGKHCADPNKQENSRPKLIPPFPTPQPPK